MKVYVASSWQNKHYPKVVARLRKEGFSVYDFQDPEYAFQWSQIDPNWQSWSFSEYAKALTHPLAQKGFQRDMKALKEADKVLLVLPCGRSAHLELGFAVGAGKPTGILSPEQCEPELMVNMCDFITSSIDNAVAIMKRAK